jgi:hypothetical protein
MVACLAALAVSLPAVQAGPKEDAIAAAKKLAASQNYSWKQKTENAVGDYGGGGSEGKIEKEGYLWLTMTVRGDSIQALKKGDKGAIKLGQTWKSLSEASAGDASPSVAFARRLQRPFKTPAAQAEELVNSVQELKKEGDLYHGEFTAESARTLLLFGGRSGGTGPDVSNAKGSVQISVKDGLLSKYIIKVQGKVSQGGESRDIDRTTTIEIMDVGTTKIEVPPEAQAKLK